MRGVNYTARQASRQTGSLSSASLINAAEPAALSYPPFYPVRFSIPPLSLFPSVSPFFRRAPFPRAASRLAYSHTQHDLKWCTCNVPGAIPQTRQCRPVSPVWISIMIRQLVDGSTIQPRELMLLPFNPPPADRKCSRDPRTTYRIASVVNGAFNKPRWVTI